MKNRSIFNLTAALAVTAVCLGLAAPASAAQTSKFVRYNACTANALVFQKIIKGMDRKGMDLPVNFLDNTTRIAAAFAVLTLDQGQKSGVRNTGKAMARQMRRARTNTRDLIDDLGAVEAFRILAERHKACLKVFDRAKVRRAIQAMK